MPALIDLETLKRSAIASYLFEGADHGGVGLSFFLVDQPPGGGPSLHVHEYDEVFFIQDGEATFNVGAETLVAHANQVVIAPGGQPHKFSNSGSDRLRLISLQPSPRAITEWLTEPYDTSHGAEAIDV